MHHIKSAAVLAGLNLICWILILLPLPAGLWDRRTTALAIVGMALSALAAAAAIAAASAGPDAPARRLRADVVAAVTAVAVILILGVAFQKVPVLPAAVLLICGTAALLVGVAAAAGLERGESIEFTSHWGGLGHSASGWKISPMGTATLLLLILLGAAMVGLSGAGGGDGNSATEASGNSTSRDRSGTTKTAPDEKAAPGAGIRSAGQPAPPAASREGTNSAVEANTAQPPEEAVLPDAQNAKAAG